MPKFKVTPYNDVWRGPIPEHYLTDRGVIEARDMTEAAQIATQKWPNAWRWKTVEIREERPCPTSTETTPK